MDDARRARIIAYITRNRVLNSTAREFVLEASDGSQLPPYEAGARIDIHLPGIGVRQYSLVRPRRAGEPYVIAVQREDGGRGGSRWIHLHLEVGATLEISAPRNHFPLAPAPKTLLIAGGIGITPLFCMAETCEREGRDHLLVVCSRSEETLVYYEDLLGPRGTCATRWLAGVPIHRDTCLGEVERDRCMAVCTARAASGAALVLDL